MADLQVGSKEALELAEQIEAAHRLVRDSVNKDIAIGVHFTRSVQGQTHSGMRSNELNVALKEVILPKLDELLETALKTMREKHTELLALEEESLLRRLVLACEAKTKLAKS